MIIVFSVVIMVLGVAIVFSAQILSAQRQTLEHWGGIIFLGGCTLFGIGFGWF